MTAPKKHLPPVHTTVTATWRSGHAFDVRGTTGAPIVIDAQKVEGMGPVDTLLGALAACTAVDLLDILAKRRTPVERLEIVVNAERRGKAPKRLMRAQLEYRITGPSIDAAHAERAIQLSVEKYCSVATSLASDVELSSVLVLNGVGHDPRRRHVAPVS